MKNIYTRPKIEGHGIPHKRDTDKKFKAHRAIQRKLKEHRVMSFLRKDGT